MSTLMDISGVDMARCWVVGLCVWRRLRRCARQFSDEIEQHQARIAKGGSGVKAGRNDPCPCGSGRKYKHCCGSHASSAAPSPAEVAGLLKRIDEHLREEGVVIPDRPEEALALLQWSQGVDSTLLRGAMQSVRDWYEEHYGGALGEPELRIRTESEFLHAIAAVDAQLRSEAVPVPGRPLRAIGEFARKLKDEPPITGPGEEPRPGRYTGADLSRRVARWYEENYGDRINSPGSLGSVVILIRSEPWEFRPPLTYGPQTTRYICEYGAQTTLPKAPQVFRRGDPAPAPAKYNIFDAAVNLPKAVQKVLSLEERRATLETFLVGKSAYEALRRAARTPLVIALRGDVQTSAEQLVTPHPHPGLSKWASLQASEKALKAYLEEYDVGFPHSHNLVRLADLGEETGLSPVQREWLEAVQCSAGVRYGDPPVSMTDAVTAHNAALHVVSHVVSRLRPLRPQHTPTP